MYTGPVPRGAPAACGAVARLGVRHRAGRREGGGGGSLQTPTAVSAVPPLKSC